DYHLGPPISGPPQEADALRESIDLYRRGRVAEAIARLENVREGSGNARVFTYRAGLLLAVGRLDEAKPDIDRALRLNARDSDAYALQSVIELVGNDKDKAFAFATRAVELDPAS